MKIITRISVLSLLIGSFLISTSEAVTQKSGNVGSTLSDPMTNNTQSDPMTNNAQPGQVPTNTDLEQKEKLTDPEHNDLNQAGIFEFKEGNIQRVH